MGAAGAGVGGVEPPARHVAARADGQRGQLQRVPQPPGGQDLQVTAAAAGTHGDRRGHM